MSLKECLAQGAQSAHDDAQNVDILGDDDLASLRKQIVQKLGSERIARLASQGKQRGKAEIAAALELELSSGEYAGLSKERRQRLIELTVAYITGLGPLQAMLEDKSISEIMVNGTKSIFVERNGRIAPSRMRISDPDQLDTIIERIVAPVGRRVDEQTPMQTAHMPGGHRANIVVFPIAYDGPYITIRKFRETMYTLDELVQIGSMEPDMARILSWAVKARKNIAVCGGTGGGKTTLLNALSSCISHDERIVTIEDSVELRFDAHPHVARLEARGRNTEGTGEVTIRDLVTNALRMRPDRIIVGECRGAEALDMLQAMTTGHDGSMTTLHASSPSEVVSRLVMMSRFGIDLPVDVIEEQIASALDLIVQQDRFPDGRRRVTAIVEVQKDGRLPRLAPIVTYERKSGAYSYADASSFIEGLVSAGAADGQEAARWGS